MNFDYDKLLNELNTRKFGTSDFQQILFEELKIRDSKEKLNFNESYQYNRLNESSAIKYVIGTMSAVAQNYTQQIISNRDGVQNVLAQLNNNVYMYSPLEFRGQGSVTNNTHIRRNSDVDLLVIIGKFYSLEPPQIPPNPYLGNPNVDLLDLRNNCVIQISNVMRDVCIDDNGAKSIKLEGGHLIIKMDVVPSNWYDSIEYSQTNNETFRGIQILNKEKMERILNYPFLFNELLKIKDSKTAGNFKRAIRFLKNVKVDAEIITTKKIKFSSYGISSLLYADEDISYFTGKSPLKLVFGILKQLQRYSSEQNFSQLTDPLNEKLNSESNTIEGLRILQGSVQKIYNDLRDELVIDKEIYIA